MALLADQSADASSNLVQGRGTNTLTFTMPGNVAIDVRSVVATIDNTAGADTTAELTIRGQSGEVIATKRQGSVIPAADTGTATFALRLADDLGPITGFIRYDVVNSGGWLDVTTTGQGGTFGAGVEFNVGAGEFAVRVTDLVFGAFRVEAPFFFYDAQGGIYRFTDSSLFDVQADQFTVLATGGATLQTANAQVTVDAADNVFAQPGAGKTFTVLDSAGNPKIQWTEGTLDLHIPAGGVIVADL